MFSWQRSYFHALNSVLNPELRKNFDPGAHRVEGIDGWKLQQNDDLKTQNEEKYVFLASIECIEWICSTKVW